MQRKRRRELLVYADWIRWAEKWTAWSAWHRLKSALLVLGFWAVVGNGIRVEAEFLTSRRAR
jgi:hypothetical protein